MDDLVKRAREGVIERPKRWTGDTHDDLGGSVDYDETDALMNALADRIETLEAQLAAADDMSRAIADNAWRTDAEKSALASYRKSRGQP